MGKLSCDVIKDLLPLYVDNICSDDTVRVVDEHLDECEKCKEILSSFNDVPQLPTISDNAEKAVVKVGKKLKKRTKKAVIKTICIALTFAVLLGAFVFLTVPLKLAEKEYHVSGFWDMQCNHLEFEITNKQKTNFNGKYGSLYIDERYGKYTVETNEGNQQLVFEDGKKIVIMGCEGTEMVDGQKFDEYCASDFVPFVTTGYPFLMPVIKMGAQSLGVPIEAIDECDLRVFKTLIEKSSTEPDGYFEECAYYFLYTIAMPLSPGGVYIVAENDLYDCYGWSLYNAYGVNHFIEVQLKSDIDKGCVISFSGFLQNDVAAIFDSFVLT